MKKVWFFCICLTIIVGGITLPEGCRKITHDRGWERVRVIKDEIAQVRLQLEAFNSKHGRYPTNDEGLLVLDNFAGRFRMSIPDYMLTGDKYRLRAAVFSSMDQHDKFPSSAADANSVLYDILNGRSPSGPMLEYDVAATDDYRMVYVFNAAGLLDVGGVPYIYENRSGLDKAMFAHSLAYTGGNKPWSIKLGRDIYVYSIEGYSIWKEHVKFRREIFLMVAVPVGLLVFFIVLYRRAKKRARDSSDSSGAWYIGLVLAVLSVMFSAPGLSCYLPSGPWRERNRTSLTQQLDLLKKYHEKGVISDATFAKAKEAMEAEIANAPR